MAVGVTGRGAECWPRVLSSASHRFHDARCHSAEAEKYDGLPKVIGPQVVGFGGFKHASV